MSAPPDGNRPPWNTPSSQSHGSTPFRPAPNDPYQAYGQITTGPATGLPPSGAPTGVIKNPRRAGAFVFAIGLLAAGLNYFTLTSEHRYYVQALFAAPMLLVCGVFFMAFGQPLDATTGKPKTWWRIGMGASLAVGVALGGYALYAVN